MVTYHVKKMTTCSLMIGQFFDTTIVPSSDKDWLYRPIKTHPSDRNCFETPLNKRVGQFNFFVLWTYGNLTWNTSSLATPCTYYYLLLSLMATCNKIENKWKNKLKILQIHTYMFHVQLRVRIGEEKFHPCLQLHGPCDWWEFEVPNEWSHWTNYRKLFLHHL